MPNPALYLFRCCVAYALVAACTGANAQYVGVTSARVATLKVGCPPEIISVRWDYRRDRWPARDFKFLSDLVANIESNHFTPESEALVRHKISSFMADFQYTLERFPNHHRALDSLVRLGMRMNSDAPQNADRTIDCWFDRATRQFPDDVIVRGLYADYLRKRNRIPEAETQLRAMALHAGDSPLTHLNVGMLYFDLKMYAESLQHAHRALALGLPSVDTLRARLVAVNQWREPGTGPAPEGTAPATAVGPNAATASTPIPNPPSAR